MSDPTLTREELDTSSKKRHKVMEDLRRIMDFWPVLLLIPTMVGFFWGPIKAVSNIADRTEVQGIEKRLKTVETLSLSLTQEMKLQSIMMGKIDGKLTDAEALYYSTQVFQGRLNDAALQIKLYGVTSATP